MLRDGVDDFFLKPYIKKESDLIMVSFVGSLMKNRITNIIESIPEIIKANNKIRFKIIGSGVDLKKYQELVSKNNLNEFVEFTGYINHEKIYEYLKDSDICFSDDWSYIGFPTKVFEYMAMEKAVLVEDTPAVREIVKENINGLLYKNSKDFANKLLELADNNKLRIKLGKTAKLDVKINHTWKKREEEFNEIMKQILK